VQVNNLEVDVTDDKVTPLLVLGEPQYLLTCSHLTSVWEAIH
jgi:hypothetical protein